MRFSEEPKDTKRHFSVLELKFFSGARGWSATHRPRHAVQRANVSLDPEQIPPNVPGGDSHGFSSWLTAQTSNEEFSDVGRERQWINAWSWRERVCSALPAALTFPSMIPRPWCETCYTFSVQGGRDDSCWPCSGSAASPLALTSICLIGPVLDLHLKKVMDWVQEIVMTVVIIFRCKNDYFSVVPLTLGGPIPFHLLSRSLCPAWGSLVLQITTFPKDTLNRVSHKCVYLLKIFKHYKTTLNKICKKSHVVCWCSLLTNSNSSKRYILCAWRQSNQHNYVS